MLDATPKNITERKALKINPAKTCQPVGAMYAALGIHRCLPHSHGSQGCCSYHRTILSRHFKEPAMASSSSFTEGASVFGGGANIKTAVRNIFALYNPDLIAVHTTCLSETIGDDLPTYIRDMDIPAGKRVIHANTPSYVGSHITGFSNMVKGIVHYLAENNGVPNGKLNVIPGFVGPADMKEIKRILQVMKIPFTLFPDTSGVLDAPTTGHYEMYPEGGTKIVDIIDSGNSQLTMALGSYASQSGAEVLKKKCEVPFMTLKTPIGIDATDEFLMALSRATGREIAEQLEVERGQLVDLMIDSQQYFTGKKVALIGDPDEMIALSQFLLALGMIPKFVVTGTPGNVFVKTIDGLLHEAGVEGKVKAEGDFFELHQWIKNEPVDLLIANTYGKFVARAENIPFVRFGFPVMDRYGHYYHPKVGYRGAMRLLEQMCDAMLDKEDRECSEEDFEVVR